MLRILVRFKFVYGGPPIIYYVPTRPRLSLKGYDGDMGCVLCAERFESLGYVLCGCPVAQGILVAAPFNFPVNITPSFSFKEWLLLKVGILTSDIFARLLIYGSLGTMAEP